MTPEQLQKIDELVAEHVMGWKTDGSNTAIWAKGNGAFLFKHNFRPARDIAAAWEVVEHLRKSRKYCCIDVRHPYAEPIECSISRISDDHETFVARANTAPLAICLAALKSQGIDINQFTQNEGSGELESSREGIESSGEEIH